MPREDRRYVYDAAWNLNFRTNNTTLNTFKVDSKNQLTNATPVGNQTYDGNGNVITSQGGMQTFSYDDENRLRTNELTGPYSRSVFTYDGLGRLRQREEYAFSGTPTFYWYLTETVRYIYDGMRVIQERNDSNVPTVSYTRGSDLSGSLEGAGGIGGLLARSHGYASTNGNWSTHNYYHADGGGNITYLVNSSQGLAASYKYDAYGNLVSQSGSLASANVYRFSSKEFHANSGLYYYGYRWYAPNLQRWLNRDPIGERYDANLYRFVYNSPLNYVDPDGLTGWALYPPQGWFDPSIPAMIQSPEYQQGFQEGAADAALKCWNAPNTLIGLAWGGVGYLFGAEITAGHNAIQFENHPFMPWGAITLGNTISYPPGFGPNYTLPNGTVGAHEMQHTFQGQVLGPFYLQANLAGGLYSLITAGNWHDNNFMEAGPMSNPPRPF